MPLDVYRTFLLRIRAERHGAPPRVSYRLGLEDAQTQQRNEFDSLESLATFLHMVVADLQRGERDIDTQEQPPG